MRSLERAPAMKKVAPRLFSRRWMPGVLLFLGCALSIASVRGGAPEPSGQQLAPLLIGVWRLDDESKTERDAIKPGAMPPELEFGAAGRFAFSNLPGHGSNVFGRPTGSIVGGTGSWTLLDGPNGERELLLAIGDAKMVARLVIEGKQPRIFLNVAGAHARNRISFVRTSLGGALPAPGQKPKS